MFIITDKKWNQGAKLEEYQGMYSIVSAREADNGGVYTQWCKPRTGQDSHASKDVPMGVKLGELRQAIKTLGDFLEYLENLTPSEQKCTAPTEDDIPF